jgi:hypothetical protein
LLSGQKISKIARNGRLLLRKPRIYRSCSGEEGKEEDDEEEEDDDEEEKDKKKRRRRRQISTAVHCKKFQSRFIVFMTFR